MSNFQTYKFDFDLHQCTIIRNGGTEGSSSFLFASAPQDALDAILRQHKLDPANIPSSWHCLYIESGGSKLVVDTGFGSQEGFPQGKLFATLQNLGIASEEIDLVFLSHSRPDHIGGCINDKGQPLYPNARYLISKTEWEFASSEEILTKIGGLFERFARQKLPHLTERIHLTRSSWS